MAGEPANSEDHWANAILLLTGLQLPNRADIFNDLLGNHSIPLMKVEITDSTSTPPNAELDAIKELSAWRHANSGWHINNTDFVVPFYNDTQDSNNTHTTGTRVQMRNARITLLGTGNNDDIIDGETTGTTFTENNGWVKRGDDPNFKQWDSRPLANYSFAGGWALEALMWDPQSTYQFNKNGVHVDDKDAVDLATFERAAKAFDRAALFFYEARSAIQGWEKQLGAEDAAWRGQAAGVFWDIIHQLGATYQDYTDALPLLFFASKAGIELRSAKQGITNALTNLHQTWHTWAQGLTSNPLRVLHDVLIEVTDYLWDNNLVKVRWHDADGDSWNQVDYQPFRTDAINSRTGESYGDVNSLDTWKKIGDEATFRWEQYVIKTLYPAADKALRDVHNSWYDLSKTMQVLTTRSISLQADFETAKNDARQDKSDADAAAAAAEADARQDKADADAAAAAAEAQARQDKADADEKAREDKADADEKAREDKADAQRAEDEQRQRDQEAQARQQYDQQRKDQEEQQQHQEELAQLQYAQQRKDQEDQEKKQEEQQQRQEALAQQQYDQQRKDQEDQEKKQEAEQRRQEELAQQQYAQQQKTQAEYQQQQEEQAKQQYDQQRKDQEDQEKRQEQLQKQQQDQAEKQYAQQQQQQDEQQKQLEQQYQQLGGGGSQLGNQLGGLGQNQIGSQTHINPDGTVTTDYSDGSSTTFNPHTGQETTTFPDGHTTTEHVGAGQSFTNPDGSTTTVNSDGTLTTHYPDGSTTTVNPDTGVATTHEPDGQTITTNLDGGASLPHVPYTGAGSLYEPELHDLPYDGSLGSAALPAGQQVPPGSVASPSGNYLPPATKIDGTTSGGMPMGGMPMGMGGMGGMGGAEKNGSGERVRQVYEDDDDIVTSDGGSLGRRNRRNTEYERETAAGRRMPTAGGYDPYAGDAEREQTESGDRERESWVPEEDDVWGTDEGGSPSVIG